MAEKLDQFGGVIIDEAPPISEAPPRIDQFGGIIIEDAPTESKLDGVPAVNTPQPTGLTPSEEIELRELDAIDPRAGLEAIPLPESAFEQPPPRIDPRSALDRSLAKLLGLGEAGVSIFLTGVPATAVGGLAGIGELISAEIRGEENTGASAAKRVEELQETLTFAPRTPEGEQATEAVAFVLGLIEEGADIVGEFELEGQLARQERGQVFADPALSATAVKTGLLALPLAFRGAKARSGKKTAAEVETAAAETGIDVSGSFKETVASVGEAARVKVGETKIGESKGKSLFEEKSFRAKDFEQIQTAIKAAKEQARDVTNQLYMDFRTESATIVSSEAVQFRPMITKLLADFDIKNMNKVQFLLDELKSLDTFPPGSQIPLASVDLFLHKMNRNRAPSTDFAQNAALSIMKGQLDNFVVSKFNADMASGNQVAIGKWFRARSSHARYKKMFKEQTVIKQLSRQKATPEEIRSWILGTAQTSFKTGAGKVVKQIKEILGEDSASMTAIRQDAMLSVIEPLIESTPNLSSFIKKYDRMFKDNPTVMKELFPESLTGLRKLRGFVGAIEKTRPTPNMALKLHESLSRVLFGHDIARKGMIVKTAAGGFDLIRKATGKNSKRKIMGDILGYDPFAPPSLLGGFETGLLEQGEQDKSFLESVKPFFQ